MLRTQNCLVAHLPNSVQLLNIPIEFSLLPLWERQKLSIVSMRIFSASAPTSPFDAKPKLILSSSYCDFQSTLNPQSFKVLATLKVLRYLHVLHFFAFLTCSWFWFFIIFGFCVVPLVFLNAFHLFNFQVVDSGWQSPREVIVLPSKIRGRWRELEDI